MLSKSYDPEQVEGRWYAHWKAHGYFRAEASSDKPPFCIVLPPPNVTGALHLGHALAATLQDILVRWKRMAGFNCLWLPGVDHAGIATQMVVEKELKKTEGIDRHALGRAEFLKRVWAWKEQYGARIGTQHEVLGASLDWSRERFTLDERSSRAVREVFVRLHEEGLIYRAQKLINWCPSCHTALSDLEVDHEEREGSLWHIRYPVAGSDRFLVVATTRPETLLGDTAVAVHPDDPRYQSLIGASVKLPLTDREIPIIGDAVLVSMELGTGAVKVTPAHDFNDYEVGLRHQLPRISLFDENARTNSEAGPYAGLDRNEARERVLADLEARGLLEKTEPHALSVGVCQRCRTVVEPRLSPQWFVKIAPLAAPAIAAVEEGKTRFVPESWTATYFSWMRNIHDWCISRQLWWGHRIPAWYCRSCSPRLGDDTDLPLDAPTVRVGGVDYARAEPLVSREPPTACPQCGGTSFVQDPDVLDTWFSSGLWPFSTLGWPEQTDELRTFYPTSVMETGHDIIFFWVARMMMMGLHFMGEVPFHTVFLHAMVRDEKGEKMSKTKGNVIDPLLVIQGAPKEALSPKLRNEFPDGMPAFGADALRFTLASLTQQGRDIKLSMERVGGYKAFGNKLWNASRFALMNMGDFQADARHPTTRTLSLADRWILSRLNRAVERVRVELEGFGFAEAGSLIYQFVWGELCDWYIELAKPALYGEAPEAQESTRAVLAFCLDRVTRLLHPYMPFITEEIWQKLPIERSVESIMLADYPRVDPRLDNPAAEAEMAPVIGAIEGVRNIRGESNLSPSLKLKAIIRVADPARRAALERWRHYLIPLAGLSEVEIGAPAGKPPISATWVGEGLEIFVPLEGLIDLDEERGRLAKELGKADAEMAGLARRLDNPSFVERAPAEVVEKDRARLDALRVRKGKLQQSLNRIAPEGNMPEENETSAALDEVATSPHEIDAADLLRDAATATVKIAEPAEDGEVDLREVLGVELSEPSAPEVDPHLEGALEKLREGTREGLSPTDHYDLGVAYLEMGLVGDAVREFRESGRAEDATPDEEALAKYRAEAKAASNKTTKKVPAAKKRGITIDVEPVERRAQPAQAAASVKKAKAPAKKPAAPAKKAKAPAKKPAASAKKAKAPTKKPAASAKKAKAPTRKPAASAKKAKAPTRKPATSAKKAKAPTKKPAASAKKAKAPTKKPAASTKKSAAAKKTKGPARKAAAKAKPTGRKRAAVKQKAKSGAKKVVAAVKKTQAKAKRFASAARKSASAGAKAAVRSAKKSRAASKAKR